GGDYRFGFQGQEKNGDLSGVDGGHLDFKYRIHDVRLGRFLSVDPLNHIYTWQSPYSFAENSPIALKELEGAEGIWGAVVGGGTEWLSQGVANLIMSKTETNVSLSHRIKGAFWDDIDFMDVGASTAQGFFFPSGSGKSLTKLAITIGGEYMKGKVNFSASNKWSINDNGTAIKQTLIGVGGAGAGSYISNKLFSNSRGYALKAAENLFKKANKKVVENTAKGTTNSATVWTENMVEQAAKDLSVKQTLNSTLGGLSQETIENAVNVPVGIAGETVESYIAPNDQPSSVSTGDFTRNYVNQVQVSITQKSTGQTWYNQKGENGTYTGVFEGEVKK
ncbi:MAG: hypothetical protein R2772_09900, partial [Chitinophagales bacterium]